MFNLVRKVDKSFLKDLLKGTNKEFAYSVAAALSHDLCRLWQMKGERMHTIIIKFGRGLVLFKFYHADETIERAILNFDDLKLISEEFERMEVIG